MSFIRKTSEVKLQSVAVISKSSFDATTHLIAWIDERAKNPLFIVFGNALAPYRSTKHNIIHVPDIAQINDIIRSLPNEIAEKNIDAIAIDSLSNLRALWNANIAGDNQPSQQQYGIINTRIINMLQGVSGLTEVFGATIGVALDDKGENYEIDLSPNLTNRVVMFFEDVNYVKLSSVTRENPETNEEETVETMIVQSNRDDALKLRLPRTEASVSTNRRGAALPRARKRL